MKSLRPLFNQALTLALLLALGVGALWFFSRPTPDSQPVAQEATSPLPTPTSVSETATPWPTVEVTTTPTPISTDTPPDEAIEPTWTPVIVLPEGSPPPVPTQIPTPTATPINPNEKELISLDMLASIGEVSPDGNNLAFNVRQQKTDSGINPYTEVWILDLVPKQLSKVADVGFVGTDQVWSADGKKLVYQLFSPNGVIEEVRVLEVIGEKDDTSLLKNENLLGYYWTNTNQLGLIRTNSIDQVDTRGQVIGSKNINLPGGNSDPENFTPKPKISGHASGLIVTRHDHSLLIQQSDETAIVITPEDHEALNISDFLLSPNGQKIAYIVRKPPVVELWVSDSTGQKRTKLYAVENRRLQLMAWSPDNRTVIVGWSHTGTNLTGGQTPVLIDTESGETKLLGIDGINVGLTFSPDGKTIYYGRSNFEQNLAPEEDEKTIFYQLQVK